MKLLGLAVIASLAFPAVSADLPVYPVEVRVDCKSAEAAEKAELKFLPLPEGKKVAFSCRWDDSNPRHLLMRNLLKKHGYKATFYLHDSGNKPFWEKAFPALHSDGFTVGNHTWGHRELPNLTPAGILYEILGWSIRLECRARQPVNAFVVPYGKIHSQFFPNVPQTIGSCLKRAGLLGGPDRGPDMPKLLHLPENEWFSSRIIRPGDRNTKPEKFDADVERHLAEAKGKPVHLTLGIHTLHSDADFLELEESLKKYAHCPDWWYCNENEYLAYSYMFRNAKIERKTVKGNQAVFQIMLPCPELLGSDFPLWAECGGKQFPIRHTRKIPVKIGMANLAGKCALYPDLSAKISWLTSNKIRLTLDNAGAPLENVLLSLRLPPHFPETVLYRNLDKITGKISIEWPVKPACQRRSAGKQLTALQLDFRRDGIQSRLWVVDQQEIRPETPVHPVHCSAKPFTVQDLEKIALPDAPLPSGKFHPAHHAVNQRNGVYDVRIPGRRTGKETLTAVMDFSGGTEMLLKGELPGTILLNGSKLLPQKNLLKFAAPEGKCRLLLVYPPGKRSVRQLVLIPDRKSE